jgi:predicted N-acetyltransferase YhbS
LVHFDEAKIILIGGVAAGLLKVFDEAPDVHLSQIQLLPEFQGRGIGSQLVEEVIRKAHARQKAVTLHVFKSNRALALYRRLGFIESSEDQHSFRMIRRPPPNQSLEPTACAVTSHACACAAPAQTVAHL